MGWNMSRWKQLPASLDPRVRQLAVQLRRIKDHSGLSLEALAARTGYSRASWDRYLNGRALPPQQAVAALAHACDVDPARLLALHEVAAGRAGGGAQQAAGPDTEGADVVRRGRRRWVLASVAAVVVAVAVVIALAMAAPWQADDGQAAAGASERAPGKGEFVFKTGKDYPCKVRRDGNGLLYAGYSRTRTALAGQQSSGWTVVEAQCLLRHRGVSPGIADGLFGPHTERAVERLQHSAHISVDGVVGEDTWRVLRK
jgi:peptidoglycan hydrolase-like protein with peptidoglycan-binding domain